MLGDDHLHDDDNDEKEYDDDDALVEVPWQGSKSGQKPLLVDLFLPDDENGVDDLENGDDDGDGAGDHPSSLSSSSLSSSLSSSSSSLLSSSLSSSSLSSSSPQVSKLSYRRLGETDMLVR